MDICMHDLRWNVEFYVNFNQVKLWAAKRKHNLCITFYFLLYLVVLE